MPKHTKPAKPKPDFPLTVNSNGQWSKKIKGKIHYFGVWADPQAALNKWLDEKDYLLAGRKPRASRDEVSVEYLCNKFLHDKKGLLNEGQISATYWAGLQKAAIRVAAEFGKTRAVSDLRADDFADLRRELAKTLKTATSIGTVMQRVKTIFHFAYEQELIKAPIRFGESFDKPPKKRRRQERRAAGQRLFTPAEIHALIGKASPQMKAMILLGINCGMGQNDIATLPLDRLDLKAGWHNYERPKTQVDRRAALWPETVKALQAAIAVRPKHKSPDDAGLVFITKYGVRWVRAQQEGKVWIDSITTEFAKLTKDIGIARTFYDLRRTFRTVADESRDESAAKSVTGVRIGALRKTRLADFNASTRKLVVRAENQKQKADQTFTLHPETCAVLSKMAGEREFMFPWSLSLCSIYLHFSRLLRAAGLPAGRRDKFHKIRRTTATFVAMASTPAAATQLLGHSSSEVTEAYLNRSIMPGNNASEMVPRPHMRTPVKGEQSIIYPAPPGRQSQKGGAA